MYDKTNTIERIDVRNMPEVIEILNRALNEGKIVEIKNESCVKTRVNIVIVQIDRKVLTRKSRD